MKQRAAFLDRDGVINLDGAYVYRESDFVLIDGVLDACRHLVELGFALVVVTNQSGIARGYYQEEDFLRLTASMRKSFEAAGAPIAGVYYCPHHPEAKLSQYRQVCPCRKPEPGLFLQAAKELDLDLSRSIAFGDKARDLQAADKAGVPVRILLGTDALKTPEPIPEATAVARSLAEAVQTLHFD